MGRILRTGFVALIVLSNTSTGGDYPPQVTGVIGENTELIINQKFSDLKEVAWKFKRGSQTLKIAEFKDNNSNFATEHPQFQIFRDGMGLRIKNATSNNTGKYTACITLKSNVIEEESFIVSLFEPLPVPTIRIEYKNGTSNTCNVTLHCDVTATTSVSYTWRYKNGSEYQLYESTGGTVQMPLQPAPLEVLCIVHNPADSKNVSVTLERCPEKVTERHQNRHHWLVFVAIFVVASAAKIIHCKTKELKHSVQETDHHISLQNKCRDPKEEYQDFFLVHEEKKDDKMPFDDGELPSKVPLQEDSEIILEC